MFKRKVKPAPKIREYAMTEEIKKVNEFIDFMQTNKLIGTIKSLLPSSEYKFVMDSLMSLIWRLAGYQIKGFEPNNPWAIKDGKLVIREESDLGTPSFTDFLKSLLKVVK